MPYVECLGSLSECKKVLNEIFDRLKDEILHLRVRTSHITTTSIARQIPVLIVTALPKDSRIGCACSTLL